jgi:hypothetical protein
MIQKNIILNKWLTFDSVIYFSAIALVMLVFYLEKILNGGLYSFVLILIFTLSLFLRWIFATKKLQKTIILFLAAIFLLAGDTYLAKNYLIGQRVTNFYADLKLVLKPDEYSQWRNLNAPLPVNENGVPANIKYYARLAWAYNGLEMIGNRPLGYGLIEQSFGHIGRIEWPDSGLTQSHSGWIDLTLGVGIPGTLLILLASYLAIINIKANPTIWGKFGFSYLLAILLFWITTELSQKVFFDSLIFAIALVSGLSLNKSHLLKNKN